MNPERICYGCFQEKEPKGICPNCGFDETAEQPFLALPLGSILNGRYLVGKVLGIGGFGITYLGYDMTLELKVAIKEYMPSGMATRNTDRYTVTLSGTDVQDYKAGEEKFLSEARILAKLQNTPNIVTVQNYFRENNTAYFVMEYIEGMSLKEYLSTQGGRISFEQAFSVLKPVMAALAKVHEKGLMHRDISPDNIYITAEGESRLLDFGAARSSMGGNKSVSVILKHGYAPEEQYSTHGNQGPWTDVYAMGATFYNCITGQIPPDAIQRMHEDIIVKPSDWGIPIPKRSEEGLMHALAVHVQDRIQDMNSLIAALEGKGVKAVPVVLPGISGQQGRGYPQANATVAAGFILPSGNGRQDNPLIKLWNEHRIPVIAGGCALLLLLIFIPVIIVATGNSKNNSKSREKEREEVSLSDEDEEKEESKKEKESIAKFPEGGTSTGSLPPLEGSGGDGSAKSGNGTEGGFGTGDTGDAAPITFSSTFTAPANDYTIGVAQGYTPSVDEEGGVTIVKDGGGGSYAVMYTPFFMYDIPLYTVADFQGNVDNVMREIMELAGATSYEVAGQEGLEIDGKQSYAVYYRANIGQDIMGVVVAVPAQNYGIYMLTSSFLTKDDANEVAQAIDTFHVTGPGSSLCALAADTRLDFYFMYDSETVTQTGVETVQNTPSYNCAILSIGSGENGPSPNYIELENASTYAQNAGGALQGFADNMKTNFPNFELLDEYDEARTDGVTFHVICYYDAGQGCSMNYAAADIGGVPYCIGAFYDDAHEDAGMLNFDMAIRSLRKNQ